MPIIDPISNRIHEPMPEIEIKSKGKSNAGNLDLFRKYLPIPMKNPTQGGA